VAVREQPEWPGRRTFGAAPQHIISALSGRRAVRKSRITHRKNPLDLKRLSWCRNQMHGQGLIFFRNVVTIM
jgi:hypothetical protein